MGIEDSMTVAVESLWILCPGQTGSVRKITSKIDVHGGGEIAHHAVAHDMHCIEAA